MMTSMAVVLASVMTVSWAKDVSFCPSITDGDCSDAYNQNNLAIVITRESLTENSKGIIKFSFGQCTKAIDFKNYKKGSVCIKLDTYTNQSTSKLVFKVQNQDKAHSQFQTDSTQCTSKKGCYGVYKFQRAEHCLIPKLSLDRGSFKCT